MAKGNMLLGYSRGSVGDVVMARVKGQQVAKARNRKPANPKTNKQVLQRSSFIAPVKFFTHGVQALFKFAFSDKKVTESDFNAFMRNNSKASFPMTKAEHASSGFPALGNYMMTKGKLPEIPVVRSVDYPNGIFIPLNSSFDPGTVGELSESFIVNGYAEVGDVITLLLISENVTDFAEDKLVVAPGSSPVWIIEQFIVDLDSNVEISDALPHVEIVLFNDLIYIGMRGYDKQPSENLHAVAYIRSRETALGLEVSTSYLHNGGLIDDYIAYRNTKAQVDKVLADWGATGDAILQGSIAKK